MTNTLTPHAAILDRITEADVCEWMQARLAKANEFYAHGIACIELCSWSDGHNRWTAHGRVNGEIEGLGWNEDRIDGALFALANDIASKPTKAEQMRQEAAALIAEAEKLEAEGAK